MHQEEDIITVAKRIVTHIDGMAEKGEKYEDAVKVVAKEIQTVAKNCMLDAIETIGGGVKQMADAMAAAIKELM